MGLYISVYSSHYELSLSFGDDLFDAITMRHAQHGYYGAFRLALVDCFEALFHDRLC